MLPPGTVLGGDPLLTSQVQSILADPVSAQRPDLMHFRPPSAGGGGGAFPTGGSGSRSGTSGGGPAAPFALAGTALVLVCAAAGLALVLRHRGIARHLRLRHRRLPRPLRLALVAVSLAVATPAAVVAGVLATRGGQQAVTPAAAAAVQSPTVVPPASVLSALRSHTVGTPVGVASRTWSSLVSIESAVVSQQDRLVSDERQITTITKQLEAAAAPSAPSETRRPANPGVLKTALEQAVADHQTAQGSYNDSLQKEYSFFVATVQSPAASSELQSIAVHTPPDVQHAIATNLDLVQTQLQQEAAIAAAAAAAQQQAAALGAAETTLGGPAPAFHPPLGGVVTQVFGPTELGLEPPITYNGIFYPHFHTGLDIAGPLDTPVQASAAGTVLLATSSVDAEGHLTGYGTYVVVSHGGGYLTLYGHLDKLLVKPGQAVQQGEAVGLLGSTGSSTGPHVHFEIRKDGVFVDPAPYLAAEVGG